METIDINPCGQSECGARQPIAEQAHSFQQNTLRNKNEMISPSILRTRERLRWTARAPTTTNAGGAPTVDRQQTPSAGVSIWQRFPASAIGGGDRLRVWPART